MPEPFLGELKIIPQSFAPVGWAMCNGSLLPINQNQALFSLLGTRYGGDGQVNFALPDLRGRVPMHVGNGHAAVGERGGESVHTLTISEMPAHNHLVQGTSSAATTPIPTGNVLANATANIYAEPAPPQPIHPATLTNVGGSQPHENKAPYLVLTVVIALQGIFPSRN